MEYISTSEKVIAYKVSSMNVVQKVASAKKEASGAAADDALSENETLQLSTHYNASIYSRQRLGHAAGKLDVYTSVFVLSFLRGRSHGQQQA